MVLNLLSAEREKGRGVVIITHDAAVARRAGRVLELKDGVLNEK